MKRTDIYSGPASGLGHGHLGHMLTLAVGGISYEGILTYLSFDLTRAKDEAIAVALGATDDPTDDLVFYLTPEHIVTTQHDTEVQT